jgi:hypothetical protein
MTYFNTRDIAAIAICGALWGVLNVLFAPTFFRATGMPFLCDLIGFAVLILGAWWIRKPGALTIVGLIATIINLALNAGMQFLGFLAASVFFDVVVSVIGYGRAFRKPAYTTVSMMLVAVASAAVAGAIIGAVFMTDAPLLTRWGGIAGWAGLHMIGGVIGGIIGTTLVLALKKRRITVYSESQINTKPTTVTNEKSPSIFQPSCGELGQRD